MYWQGYRVSHIAKVLGEKPATIHSWKRRDQWAEKTPVERAEITTEARLNKLVMKENKEGKDFKEIDLLARVLERTSRIRKYDQTGRETDLNPNIENRNKAPKRVPQKNPISDEQHARLVQVFMEEQFDYQRTWYRSGLVNRIRDILKSRQIGATFYFAREAFIDALETGRNQIFLSASKAQAHVFKNYIIRFAQMAADVELKGDPIILPNAATMYFLGTNSKTAQSYHGNLYIDEFFWINKFTELRKVASGMAAHKHWRQTYFSTPSSLNHEAYPYWSGELFNKGRPASDRADFDISHAALKGGAVGADGHWRQIVTVMDAMAGGCDLFDIEQLQREYGPQEFANLFMAGFIDDTLSVFSLADMQRGMVDSWTDWDDYKPFAVRPLGYEEVWVGYDPNLGNDGGDSAGCVVVAPPKIPGGKFRVIEKHRLGGMDFEKQADFIKKITERYNVTYIGIDVTGIGHGVSQLVKKFFANVREFSYSVESKSALVMKALNVISKGRLEFDAGWTDFAQAFMAIKKTITPGGTSVTYVAGRSKQTSHSDIAWATMHALANEPLAGGTDYSQGSILEIYS